MRERVFERGESTMFGTMLSSIMAWIKELYSRRMFLKNIPAGFNRNSSITRNGWGIEQRPL
jgi:hypothetical protein